MLVTIDGERVISVKPGDSLLAALKGAGTPLSASCGGFGKCGRCKAFVSENGSDYFEVLACEYHISCDINVRLPKDAIIGLWEFGIPIKEIEDSKVPSDEYNLAIDLGTTTISFYLLKGSKILKSYASQNPQRAYGADVISRISASREHLNELQGLVLELINSQIEELKNAYGFEEITKVYVAANTTMLHILKGESPLGLGEYPYTASFLEEQNLNGEEHGIHAKKVVLAPCVSAFVGGDITVGAVAANLECGELLIDLGTNGELMLKTEDGYLCTSTAIGPCFEGGGISSGVPSIQGAITKVFKTHGGTGYETIGDTSPRGICGSGLADGVALMLNRGIIDKSGRFLQGSELKIAENIGINQQDIRTFQLAKGALKAGILCLLARAKLTPSEVKKVYLSGGFGYYLNPESAVTAGLLPAEFYGKTQSVGNSSGMGAVLAILSDSKAEAAKKIGKAAKYIDLSQDVSFFETYVSCMNF